MKWLLTLVGEVKFLLNFKLVNSGRDQFPIDIGIVEKEKSTEIEFDY